MAISDAIATSFKVELMNGEHDLGSGNDTIRIALYTSSATLNATTTAYTATNEVAQASPEAGYITLGQALTTQVAIQPTESPISTSCIFDADNPQWASATITARGCMLYNDTHAGKGCMAVWDFGEDKIASGGNFDITFPSPATGTALLELA